MKNQVKIQKFKKIPIFWGAFAQFKGSVIYFPKYLKNILFWGVDLGFLLKIGVAAKSFRGVI